MLRLCLLRNAGRSLLRFPPAVEFRPTIDKQVLREFAAIVPREYPELGLWVWKTQQTGTPVLHKHKKIGAVPHD
jgi:non-lysosomal glucosylceramidase